MKTKIFLVTIGLGIFALARLLQAQEKETPEGTASILATRLIEATEEHDVKAIEELIAKGADPNMVVKGRTAFLVADDKSQVDQSPSKEQQTLLEAFIKSSLSGVADQPTLTDIREAIKQALLDEHPLKDVASVIVQVYPDRTFRNAVRVRCDAIAYDGTAGYQLLNASERGLVFKAPPDRYTWCAVEDAATDIRIRRNNRGKWTGQKSEGVSFSHLKALESISVSPEAYKQDLGGVPAILLAMLSGNDDIACRLVEATSKDNPWTSLQLNPFVFAGYTNCRKTMSAMLKRGISVDTTASRDNVTALLMATQSCNSEIVKLLLDAGATPDKPKTGGITALMMAAMKGDVASVKLLLDAGAGVNIADERGDTALHYAAASGWATTVDVLRRANADTQARNLEGKSVYDLAEKNGHTELAKSLKTEGDSAKALQLLAIESATVEGDAAKVLQLLVSDPSLIKYRGASDMTLLHLATREGKKDVLSALLAHGADVNETWDNGSALHIAVVNERIDIIQYLLSKGADKKLENKEGQTASQLASVRGNSKVIKAFKSVGQ